MTEYYWMGFHFTLGAAMACWLMILIYGILAGILKAWKNRKK
jgi:hypothetical protein